MPRQNNINKHIRRVYQKSCNSKRCYKNEKEAKATADYQMLIHQNIELAVYKCNECIYWHLTNVSDSKKKYN